MSVPGPGSNDDNSVFGVDFRYLNSQLPGGRSIESEVWLQQSDTEGRPGDDGAAGFAVRMPSSEGWRGGFGMTRIESNFNPALGFVRRRGIDQVDFGTAYTWRPQGGPIRTISSGINYDRIEFLDSGEIQSESINLKALDIDLNSQDSFNVRFSRDREGLRQAFEISPGIVIAPGLYTFDSVNAGFRAGNQRAFSGGFFTSDGEFYNGERFGMALFFNARPSRHFRTGLNYQYNEIDLPGGSFVTRVVRLTFEAVLSSKLSWINLIQYDNISETIGINSRVHWIPQAGREGFIVFNHNLTGNNGSDIPY